MDTRATDHPETDLSPDEPPEIAFERHPSDVVHLVAALALFALALAMTAFGGGTLLGFETDVIEVAARAPDAFTRLTVQAVQVAAILTPIVGALLLLALRKVRALLTGLLACALGAGALRLTLVALDREPPHRLGSLLHQAGIDSYGFPNVQYLAGATAALTVLTPWMNRPWRRLTWGMFALAIAARLATGTAAAGDLLLAVTIGWAAGSSTSLACGAPTWHPRRDDVVGALTRAGLAVASLTRTADALRVDRWRATLTDGSAVSVTGFGDDERGSDLLVRAYRWVRTRDLGDQRPFSSLRRRVEHEALLSLAAGDAQVRTPRFLAFATVGASGSSFLLAYEQIDARPLDHLDPETLDDALLVATWEQVRALHARRIAHRRLGLASVLVDAGGKVWLNDFSFGELAAPDGVLATDVAQLLASTARQVGPTRAVATAARALGVEALGAALPRLQVAALDDRTRRVLRHHRELLHELQGEVQRVAGVEQVRYEQLQRVRPRTVLMVLALGAAVYFVYPQLADLDDAVMHLRDASPGWVLVAVGFTAFTFAAAALSLMGSVPGRIGFLPTLEAQVASAFAGRVTPASAGGYAVNVRFLQHQGIDAPVAVTGVGLNALGGLLVHLPLLVLFVAWAGKQGTGSVQAPSAATFLWISVGFLVVGTTVAAIPATRRFVVGRGVAAVRNAASGLAAVAREPSKLRLLLGGSLGVTVAYVLALGASVQAFGGGVDFVSIAATYLTASAVGAVAPTPGGLGGVEAALLAGLTVAGLDNVTALSSVFLFRIITFWLPIAPGWVALHMLVQRSEL